MNRKPMNELQFLALLAIEDQERREREIRTRMAALSSASGTSTHVPGRVDTVLEALRRDGLVARRAGSGLFGANSYSLTNKGYKACQHEIDLRRRALDGIAKNAQRWLRGSAQR